MTNTDYLNKFNNPVDMESAFKVKLHEQAIIGIVSEEKYMWGRYEIIDPNKKEVVQQEAKGEYLACDFICQSNTEIYGRLVE